MVFVHGMGARADRWRRNLEVFAEAGYRALAIDLPGHGLAQKGESPTYTIPGFADFLAAFIEQAGLKNPILVGTSLGGNIVASLACRAPALAKALVLVGSLGLVPLPLENRQKLQKGLLDATPAGTRQKLQRVLFDAALVTDQWVREESLINGSAEATAGFRKLGDYVAGEPGINGDGCGRELAALTPKLPTLLVWGAEDRSVPLPVGREAHAMLPRSQLVVMEGCAHAPYFEQPGRFNQVVLDFLRTPK
jgi:pimeloyl-ACP methyl ester carboxylesterase